MPLTRELAARGSNAAVFASNSVEFGSITLEGAGWFRGANGKAPSLVCLLPGRERRRRGRCQITTRQHYVVEMKLSSEKQGGIVNHAASSAGATIEEMRVEEPVNKTVARSRILKRHSSG